MDAQICCTVQEVVASIGHAGEERMLFQRIKDASRYITGRFGRFIPFVDTFTLQGVSTETLMLKIPVLEITAVRVDGAAVTDYTACPEERCWPNGPYTWLERDAGWGESVEIEGVWGLYNELVDLGITADQDATAVTLTVDNGSILSPGMVIRIGDEQELVTTGNGGPHSPSASPATSLLSALLPAESSEVAVDDSSEFFEGEVLQIGVEDMLILKIGGNTLFCERSYNKTARVEHANDAPISVYRTYKVVRGVNGTDTAAHTDAAVQRYTLPSDVSYLAQQIAALMHQKAKTSFMGRAGNPEAGDTFYINEFPRQIADIETLYSIPYL